MVCGCGAFLVCRVNSSTNIVIDTITWLPGVLELSYSHSPLSSSRKDESADASPCCCSVSGNAGTLKVDLNDNSIARYDFNTIKCRTNGIHKPFTRSCSCRCRSPAQLNRSSLATKSPPPMPLETALVSAKIVHQ